MADRYRTPGGWTVEVVQLDEGEGLRVRHHGFCRCHSHVLRDAQPETANHAGVPLLVQLTAEGLLAGPGELRRSSRSSGERAAASDAQPPRGFYVVDVRGAAELDRSVPQDELDRPTGDTLILAA